jgi:hypothetical protein
VSRLLRPLPSSARDESDWFPVSAVAPLSASTLVELSSLDFVLFNLLRRPGSRDERRFPESTLPLLSSTDFLLMRSASFAIPPEEFGRRPTPDSVLGSSLLELLTSELVELFSPFPWLRLNLDNPREGGVARSAVGMVEISQLALPRAWLSTVAFASGTSKCFLRQRVEVQFVAFIAKE